jgi:phosphoribosylformylglycinamidine cyclo-ligase
MYSTFNMGVGFILIIPKDRASQVLQELSALGESAKVIGEVISRKDEEVEMI